MTPQLANCSTALSREIATVVAPIQPHQPGRVWYQASYWPAQLWSDEYQQSLASGTNVIVVAQQGITLLVAPQNQAGQKPISGSQQGLSFLSWLFG